MSEDWQPLSVRESGRPSGLREGVPDGLARPLRGWIEVVCSWLPSEVVERLGVLLDLDLDSFWTAGPLTQRLAAAPTNDKLLEVADAVLNSLSTHVPLYARPRKSLITSKDKHEVREMLQQLLDDARSVYQVREDHTGLERRVDPAAAELVAQAAVAAQAKADSGSASKQLREASDAVRAMQPNAPLAYSLAIKAVESAAHAVIEPNNKKATLGTMLRVLETNVDAFEVEILAKDGGEGRITPVTGMMRMLWDGQTSRHGSKQPAREETRGEAEMAVQLASVLVLWFSAGSIRRK